MLDLDKPTGVCAYEGLAEALAPVAGSAVWAPNSDGAGDPLMGA